MPNGLQAVYEGDTAQEEQQHREQTLVVADWLPRFDVQQRAFRGRCLESDDRDCDRDGTHEQRDMDERREHGHDESDRRHGSET